MEVHIRAAGIANILLGLLGIVGGCLIFLLLGGPVSLAQEGEIGLLIAAFGIGNLLIGVPCIFLGAKLMLYTSWVRAPLIVVSALNLLNIPFGSVVGTYTLWVLLAQESEPILSEPPPGYRSAPAQRAKPQVSASTASVSSHPQKKGAMIRSGRLNFLRR